MSESYEGMRSQAARMRVERYEHQQTSGAPGRPARGSSRRAAGQRGWSVRGLHFRQRRAQPRDSAAVWAGRAVDRAGSGSGGGGRGAGRSPMRGSRRCMRASASLRQALADEGHRTGGWRSDGPGVSSPQLDDGRRGFSFKLDGPLDMRMDTSRGITAAQWLATASENQIGEVIRTYGEERFAKQIARAIVAARSRGALDTTRQLAEIVGRRRPHARARPGPGDAHLPGYTDSRQSRA